MRTLLPIAFLLSSAPLAEAQCELRSISISASDVGDAFGYEVTLEGDVAVLSAPFFFFPNGVRGAAFVFERTAGAWERVARLRDGPTISCFASNVALDGNRAVVSSFVHSDNAGGQAFVYERGPMGWERTKRLRPANPGANSQFGITVGLEGDLIVVGATKDDSVDPSNLGCDNGGAYLFHYDAQSADWIEGQKLVASDARCQDVLGYGAVQVEGGRIFVGGYRANAVRGAVYVWEPAGATYAETARIVAGDGEVLDWFGFTLEAQGDELFVSAPRASLASTQEGAVYVFERDAASGQWARTQKLAAPDSSNALEFGADLDVDGDQLLIGAARSDYGCEPAGEFCNSGAAYLYRRTPAGWEPSFHWTAEERVDRLRFGTDVGLSNGTALLGAPGPPSFSFDTAGRVHERVAPDFAHAFCACEGAPCSNGSAVAGCANSSGLGASVDVCGGPSVANDDLILSARDLPPHSGGLWVMGDAAPFTPFGDGGRCVGGARVFRFPAGRADADGRSTLGPGIVALTQALFSPAGQIGAGQTFAFQRWFRDPVGPCGSGLGASNAVSVTFVP